MMEAISSTNGLEWGGGAFRRVPGLGPVVVAGGVGNGMTNGWTTWAGALPIGFLPRIRNDVEACLLEDFALLPDYTWAATLSTNANNHHHEGP